MAFASGRALRLGAQPRRTGILFMPRGVQPSRSHRRAGGMCKSSTIATRRSGRASAPRVRRACPRGGGRGSRRSARPSRSRRSCRRSGSGAARAAIADTSASPAHAWSTGACVFLDGRHVLVSSGAPSCATESEWAASVCMLTSSSIYPCAAEEGASLQARRRYRYGRPRYKTIAPRHR